MDDGQGPDLSGIELLKNYLRLELRINWDRRYHQLGLLAYKLFSKWFTIKVLIKVLENFDWKRYHSTAKTSFRRR